MSIAFEKSWKQLAAVVSRPREASGDPAVGESILSETECSVIAAMPGAVALVMPNGNLVCANAHFEEMIGFCDLAVTQNSFLDCVNPQDKVAVLNAIGNCDENTEPVSMRFHFIGENRQPRMAHFEMEWSPYQSSSLAHGKRYVLCLFRDVTSSVSVEEKLRSDITALEEKSGEQAQFFAAMSHELRTPLNAILGFSELLEGKLAIPLADDKRVEYAGHIHQSASHLLGIINNVLDLSKLEAGKLELDPQELDLKLLIEDMLRGLKPIASAKQVSLSLIVDQDLPLITADARALRQVFTNLLSNAVKFSHVSDEVTVSIKRRRKSLAVAICDRGIGMDKATLEQLGTVFFQADGAISKDYEGSGLGLSIVHNLLDLMGGKIDVQSALGKGSTFTVQIPISAAVSVPVPSSPDNEVIYLKPKQPSSDDGQLSIACQNGGR